MRRLLPQDINLMAIAFSDLSERDLKKQVTLALEQAHFADKYRKRFGRSHKIFGDGSVSLLLALRQKGPQIRDNRKGWIGCYFAILKHVIDWQADLRADSSVNCQAG